MSGQAAIAPIPALGVPIRCETCGAATDCECSYHDVCGACGLSWCDHNVQVGDAWTCTLRNCAGFVRLLVASLAMLLVGCSQAKTGTVLVEVTANPPIGGIAEIAGDVTTETRTEALTPIKGAAFTVDEEPRKFAVVVPLDGAGAVSVRLVARGADGRVLADGDGRGMVRAGESIAIGVALRSSLAAPADLAAPVDTAAPADLAELRDLAAPIDVIPPPDFRYHLDLRGVSCTCEWVPNGYFIAGYGATCHAPNDGGCCECSNKGTCDCVEVEGIRCAPGAPREALNCK